MRAGTAVGDLTPQRGVPLGGYPYFKRANTGVHDPLNGAALYLEDHQGSAVLLIATDLLWITKPQADAVRARVAERTGIDPDRVILTASHSHSAPAMFSLFQTFPTKDADEDEVDEGYIEFAIERCAQVGAAAMAAPFDAEVGYAKVVCGAESGIGGNRRDPANGPTDPDVPVLAVRDSEGVLRAVWTAYALHPTIMHGENTLVSADFPGAIRTALARELPDAVLLYSMGAAGNQSPRYFRSGQTFAEVDRFGNALAGAVIAALSQVDWLVSPRLKVASRAVDLIVKSYPAPEVVAERIAALRSREAELIAAAAPYVEQQTANLSLLGAECDYHNAARQADGTLMDRYHIGAPYVVTALTIGEAAWAFLPGELFCEFGLSIKSRSPFPNASVVTMANGDLPGYCVTAEAMALGGYEAGNSILDPRSGDLLADAAIDLLTTFHQSESGAVS